MDVVDQIDKLLYFQRWLVYNEDPRRGATLEARGGMSISMHSKKDEIIAEFERLQKLETLITEIGDHIEKHNEKSR